MRVNKFIAYNKSNRRFKDVFYDKESYFNRFGDAEKSYNYFIAMNRNKKC